LEKGLETKARRFPSTYSITKSTLLFELVETKINTKGRTIFSMDFTYT